MVAKRRYRIASIQLEEIDARRVFDWLLDEVRYGFKKGVYMSYRNIGVVVQGLADMGYLDTELFEQAISKVFEVLTAGGKETREHR